MRPHDPSNETADASLRDCFEIDFDRVLYSAEFRRLAGVTQVISPQDDYVFHDRLTHSLKVSQMAARIASYLRRSYEAGHGKGSASSELKVNPTVCATAGLIHDIGHPPFGHAAETVLQEALNAGVKIGRGTNRALLADSFEGNAQSMRAIARLSMRKHREKEQRGMNLTWRTLAAASKYPWTRDQQPQFYKTTGEKWGFYDSERDYLDLLVEKRLIEPAQIGNAKNVEASIMDWADDIAYAVHDVEDFFRAGRIPLHSLSLSWESRDDDENGTWNQLLRRTSEKVSSYYSKQEDAPTLGDISELAAEHIVTWLPSHPFDGSHRSHADIHTFGSAITTFLQSSCSIKNSAVGNGHALLISPEARIIAEFLKSTTVTFVINDPVVATMQRGQSTAIRDVFEYLLETTLKSFSKNDSWLAQRSLPPRLREYVGTSYAEAEPSDSEDALAARGVVDFLCSLTDKQTSLLHQRITGDSIQSLPPYWLTA
ncbi:MULTISPECIES: deoxyguanosinetriphosphate triphosphohydrolase family protein [unclassified Rhodococcus (in: high G+C Gram-positive bacteria)]|uniref:deoxyguanosinetriphosphate triphosphohydrolase family protein n=1 Tax=unclassified Rhodococcus (in: high G+C Gram-positive bacteria) TaxID=192944 RepID=UPI0015C59A44|nr:MULTISPECIES: dNTP triphosphohydrolase [unclassified Rhodococcus (in: high G+C Gram-positive bacteria)]